MSVFSPSRFGPVIESRFAVINFAYPSAERHSHSSNLGFQGRCKCCKCVMQQSTRRQQADSRVYLQAQTISTRPSLPPLSHLRFKSSSARFSIVSSQRTSLRATADSSTGLTSVGCASWSSLSRASPPRYLRFHCERRSVSQVVSTPSCCRCCVREWERSEGTRHSRCRGECCRLSCDESTSEPLR